MVAKQILESFGDSQQVHILAHSLGCSIIHDSLAKQYSDKSKIDYKKNLSIHTHKLGSINMIANTSRVLQSFIKVKDSLVKPGPTGCTSKFIEYRHILDPITWPMPFNPTDNGVWISNDSWNIFKRYKYKRLTSVTSEDGNVHNISHYLLNPKVHQENFKNICGIKLSKSQQKEGYENFYSKTLGNVATELETAVSKLKVINIENISGLFKSIKTLKEFIEKLGGQYNG